MIIFKNEIADFLNSISHIFSETTHLSPRFKKFGKIRLWSKLSLGLIYGMSFLIQAASYFQQSLVQKTGIIFYLADFHGRNWKGRFYFHKTP